MTFQQSYDKIVAVICGVDTGLLNGKRERAMKEETFKNKILWYNFIMCLLVVCIHAQNMHIFLEPVPWINQSISFLVERIACLAVPGFFMCSGYLFYLSLIHISEPTRPY